MSDNNHLGVIFTGYLLAFFLAVLYEYFLGEHIEELSTLIKYAIYGALGLTLLEAIMR